ncbi:TetR/AcrR family transcriptional regulator [Pseudoroseomonas ludipueritiae]|uniref:TetR/AcrR family transcriptional regulator n=1 Tax=Pseudoroseomonas ludipueritiae TaxID=198093 RepID=UPI003463560D
MTDAATTKPRSPAAQRLRTVAKDLFYRQGIRATGVEELCRIAGTTKISLYRAYPSKDELIAAILRDECADGTCLISRASGPAVPPRERPAACIAAAAEALRTPGFRGCPVGLAIAEFPDPEHPARKVADSHKLKTREDLRQLCAEAGAAEPAMLGDALLLLLEGAFSAAPYLGNEEAAEVLERSGRALLAMALPPTRE